MRRGGKVGEDAAARIETTAEAHRALLLGDDALRLRSGTIRTRRLATICGAGVFGEGSGDGVARALDDLTEDAKDASAMVK